jgi:hypothetical protein
VVSIFWHSLGSALVYLLLRQFYSVVPSLVGTLFFAVHGAQFLSVFWISALPEPMAVVFYLAALLFFIRFERLDDRRAYAASIGAMLLGVMSKESILTLPLVLAAYCAIFVPRRLLWTFPHFILSGIYVYFRLTSRLVDLAPYPLGSGREAWQNLLAYFSWSAGFTEALLKSNLGLDTEKSYPWIAGGFAIALLALFVLSRNKRAAAFSLLWYLVALQPVLYFSGHIFAYYLGASLPAIALLIASALSPAGGPPDWKPWFPVLVLLSYCLWFSNASVRSEGRWWTDRSFVARDILAKMPLVDRQVPEGRMAYILGFGEWEFGVLQNSAAFRAFGFSPNRFSLVGLNNSDAERIRLLKEDGALSDYYCFVYSGGNFINATASFGADPEKFLPAPGRSTLAFKDVLYQNRPEVRMEVGSREVLAGQGHFEFKVVNLDVPAIDILYSVDGRPMPPIYRWRLDENRSARVFVDKFTPKGIYSFKAIRDSRDVRPRSWIRVDVELVVK